MQGAPVLELSCCDPEILDGLADLQGLPLQWLRLCYVDKGSLPGCLGLAVDRAHSAGLASRSLLPLSPELLRRLCLPAGDGAGAAAVVGLSGLRPRRDVYDI